MILKQLKQLTLSATRRNALVPRLLRLYTSPAVCQSFTTSKPYKRLSRNDRRALVESFVVEYRAANAGKFPTVTATVKEVGGCKYVVRDILQELKLRPNALISRVPASAVNDVCSETQDVIESDDVSLQGDNNLVTTATHDKSEIETAPLDKDVDSKCDSDAHLGESQTLMESEECLKNSETEEEIDHLEAANVLPTETRDQCSVTTATHDRRETETALPINGVDSTCDDNADLLDSQMLQVSEECLKNSETEKEGKLTQVRSQEPKADHLEGANVLPTETKYQYSVTTVSHVERETETAPPYSDLDSKCDGSVHLPNSQTLKVLEECSKNSEIEEDGTLTHLGSQEPEADHLEGADVLPNETKYQHNVITETDDKSNTETTHPINGVDSKCDGRTHLPDNQTSKVLEKCVKNSETEKEGTLTHLDSQEPKANHLEGGNVLPSETRQVSEKGDGDVKTGENSSAWSNIISFAKEFANFWRKG